MNKFSRIVRTVLRKFLVGILDEVLIDYKTKKWDNIKMSFKYIGKNVFIEYPYLLTGLEYITIGNDFQASNRLRLQAISNYQSLIYHPEILIGNNVTIESNCHIGAMNKIIIEDNVMIASNVYISDHFHGLIHRKELDIPPILRDLSSKGPIIIKKNVWIGDSVCILPGVTIGENAIIGANSVVTKSVPANTVVAGVPARIIRQL